MAGIGFLLRKFSGEDDFTGIIRAYFHSAIAAVGPWILIVVSLGLISLFTYDIFEANEFFAIIIYNVFFSFILSSPLYMITARYVADCLFARDTTPVPGILITGLFYLLIPCLLIAIIFYGVFTTMTPFSKMLSIINFVFLCEIWFVMLFLTSIRNFHAITASWILGIIVGTLLGIYFGRSHGSIGMLLGIDIGLILILFPLKANILAEYPYRFFKPKDFYFYFKHYKGLFWSGFFLFAGMWIDKVIMWGAPESIIHLNNLRTYPDYDGAMFLSYLSIIPAMAFFILMLETNFYDSYIQYIRNIETNAALFLIEEEKNNLIKEITENGRVLLILQGVVTFIVIAAAPIIFNFLNINYLEFNIFRFGALGAFFAALNLIIVVLFSYFDSQENMLVITMLMFFSNVVFTFATIALGFPYYGLGYALSMIFTFFIGATLFIRFLKNLTYHVFISHVIKRNKIIERNLLRNPIKKHKIPKSQL